MKIARIFFLVIGILLAAAGLFTSNAEPSADLAFKIGYWIGGFIPAAIFLFIAYIFHNKIKKAELKKEKEMFDTFLSSEEKK